jgi:hypothetical protein
MKQWIVWIGIGVIGITMIGWLLDAGAQKIAHAPQGGLIL